MFIVKCVIVSNRGKKKYLPVNSKTEDIENLRKEYSKLGKINLVYEYDSGKI